MRLFRGMTLSILVGALVWIVPGSFDANAQVQQVSGNTGSAAAWQALLRLRTTATVMHTTAHPDDEDGALLAWLSRKQGVRTGLLTLNRGEGGANAIGPELYDALGVLRTEELLAAGRYYGVDQMFTRVTDFGFSKRMDETLEHWGKENVLRDVVRAVRVYRPDVLVARFHGKARDGHGNHQTAGLMSIEVFRAAADPNRFPEQLTEGLRPWQIKKFYQSVRENEPATLKLDVGEYDPLLGKSYREIAREGLSYQRSQGAGQSLGLAGPGVSGVQLVETTLPKSEKETSLYEGLDVTVPGIAKLTHPSVNITAELTTMQTQVSDAINKFDARRPWNISSQLAAGLKATRAAIAKVKFSQVEPARNDQALFLLNNKEKEFQDAMNKALAISMDLLVDPPQTEGQSPFRQSRETFAVAVPGQQFTLTAAVVNRGQTKIEPSSITLRAPSGWQVTSKTSDTRPLGFNEVMKSQFDVTVPENAEFTRPYWQRQNEFRDFAYQLRKPSDINLPWSAPDVIGTLTYKVDGVEFTHSAPAQTTFVDRPWGEQRRLLMVAPALNVGISPKVGVIPVAAASATYSVKVSVSNNVSNPGGSGKAVTGKVRLKLPAGWKSTPSEAPFSFTHEGETQNFSFQVSVPSMSGGSDYKVQAVADYNGREYSEGYRVIAHRDLEPRHLYRDAVTEIRAIDVKVAPGLKVGYIMGVGDEIPAALEQIGVKVQMLSSGDLATINLDQFDAIVVGIRASTVRDDYKAYNRRLLDYVENGGNLVVQYQTQEWDSAPYGPYPYKLGPRAEEVSEEDAKVTVLDPENPVFNWPNKITAADFDNWVEERGSKWMSTWDERYKPLLESHDREQTP